MTRPLPTMTMDYDYIVVGAGAAGCVVASRLSEDPKTRVLLLEAGGTDDGMFVSVPAGDILLMGNAKYDWCFETEPDATINGRALAIPRGKLLGGSNSINGMIHVRGHTSDYDHWHDLGNEGWSYREVLPYFMKSEHFERGGSETRGSGGPLHIADPTERHQLCDVFIEAAVAEGFARNEDYNSGELEGFGYYQVNQRGGRRWSVVRGYLHGARARHNLRIETGTRVTKLLFAGRRCVGVACIHKGLPRQLHCNGEVILSAGAVQSPQLLEISGIGSRLVLERFGIPVMQDLPGVGENYRDHYATRMKWRVKLPVTFNERTRGLALMCEIGKYFLLRRGVLTLPIALAHGFVRTRPELAYPDIQFHFAPASYCGGSNRRLDASPGMTLGIYQLRPESSGSIHVKSPDPFLAPAIRSNFLAEAEDRRCLLAGMKIARRIAENPAMDRFRGVELSPGSHVQSDDEWLAYARAEGDTSYHPVGTCKMGRDSMAVVDARLRVRGVGGLRVVDASVMPTMVSGNTSAATIMIAERAADLLKADANSATRAAA